MYFVALVFVALMISPVLYLVVGGFRTNAQITTDPSGWPDPWQVGNYVDVLTGNVFWRQVLNSAFAAGATTIGVVVLGLMASFAIARYR